MFQLFAIKIDSIGSNDFMGISREFYSLGIDK